jgi:hypothetical protein
MQQRRKMIEEPKSVINKIFFKKKKKCASHHMIKDTTFSRDRIEETLISNDPTDFMMDSSHTSTHTIWTL